MPSHCDWIATMRQRRFGEPAAARQRPIRIRCATGAAPAMRCCGELRWASSQSALLPPEASADSMSAASDQRQLAPRAHLMQGAYAALK